MTRKQRTEHGTTERAVDSQEVIDEKPRDEGTDRTWADEAAQARTSDDPRARTPRDAAGQPSNRPFDE